MKKIKETLTYKLGWERRLRQDRQVERSALRNTAFCEESRVIITSHHRLWTTIDSIRALTYSTYVITYSRLRCRMMSGRPAFNHHPLQHYRFTLRLTDMPTKRLTRGFVWR